MNHHPCPVFHCRDATARLLALTRIRIVVRLRRASSLVQIGLMLEDGVVTNLLTGGPAYMCKKIAKVSVTHVRSSVGVTESCTE